MIITCAAMTAYAQESSVFSEENIPALLSQWGYPAEQYTLGIQWTERAQNGEEVFVHGFHLIPADGTPGFDVYCDDQGQTLTDGEVYALGITPKDWTPRSICRKAEIQPGFPNKAVNPLPMIFSERYTTPVPELLLPEIDREQALLEDESGISVPDKGVARIGVIQELAQPVQVRGTECSDGVWQILPDGTQVWTLEIRSLESFGQRFHFARLQLPAGASVVIYDPAETDERYGPFVSETDFWAPTCFGESAVIECQVPAQTAADGVDLLLDQVTYNYRSLLDMKKNAGSCNLDVSCYPLWANTALGVAGIGSIGQTGTLWCTGSLVTDDEPATFTPYFLTANHCVSKQSQASTIEAYWLYQTSACNATPPSPSTVPRTTGGADYLAGTTISTGTDFAFLRLRQSPPSGLMYLGFNASQIPLGTQLVCIHHPDGDYKRISFGTKVDSGSPATGGSHLRVLSRFHEILWNQATTEPGSSGSPLFYPGNHTIVGQLWGGNASCSAPEEPDYFGRFDVTYPLVESYLGIPTTEGEGQPEGEIPYDCDIDQSGVVDNADVLLVIRAAIGTAARTRTDVNLDGTTDASDIQWVVMAAARV